MAALNQFTVGFLAIPSVNKQLIIQLARCEYVDRRENVIAIGNSGTGKTHVALGLGLAACQRGLSVGFTTAASGIPRSRSSTWSTISPITWKSKAPISRDAEMLLSLRRAVPSVESLRSGVSGYCAKCLARPDVTVLHCRIPSELHRRLRHLVVDEDSSVTAKVIEMIQEGLERRGR